MSFWAQGRRAAPTEVEILPSEERGKIKAPKRRRDMAQNFGGFLVESNIHYGKSPRLQAISLRRIRSSVFARIVAYGSLPHKNFDYGLRPSLRMTYRGFI